MNGTSSLKTALKTFQTEWSLSWIEALLLIGGGVAAVVLHRALDMSLGLPGHHGIEWMAIMILGRASSRFRGAGTLTSMGASFASVLPFLHGDNPFTWIYYLLPGPVMDLAFRYLPRYANKLWFMVLLGGGNGGNGGDSTGGTGLESGQGGGTNPGSGGGGSGGVCGCSVALARWGIRSGTGTLRSMLKYFRSEHGPAQTRQPG